MTNKIRDLFAELGVDVTGQQLQHRNPKDFQNIVQFREWLSNWIAEAYALAEESQFAREVQLINKAEEYILAHLSEDIAVGDVADALFVSERHFSRLFKKEYGISFSEYLNAKRLNRAEILLQNTNKKIGDIAVQCSFHSDSYFIRQFKKKVGMTPKEYSLRALNEGAAGKLQSCSSYNGDSNCREGMDT